jgi:hypothetical protein
MFKDTPITPEKREAELENLRHEPLLSQLRDDIRNAIARDLPNFRAREKEFSSIDTCELLSIYLNWKHRQVHPHPRTVVYSAELSERIRANDALYGPVKSEFHDLTRSILNGEDLLFRNLLSQAVVRRPYELQPDYSRLNQESHVDLLLNEQGIHHLHLPGLQRKEGAPIVFAIFEPYQAVLLDLARHDDYQTDRLARISYGNWPQRHFRKLMVDTLLDSEGNEIELNDQHRTGVRNNAINSPIKIDDRVYVTPSAGGITANGFALSVAKRSTDIWNSLSLFVIRRYRERFDAYFFEKTSKPLPENPAFHFRFWTTEMDWSYAIWEGRSNCAFLLPNDFGITR